MPTLDPATVHTLVTLSVITLAAVVGVGLTLLTLSGQWLAPITAISLQLLYHESFSWWTIAIAVLIAGVGELVENVAGAAGAARAGGGKKAAVGAIVGGLVGAVVGTIFLAFIPILGTLIGAMLGAGLGAALVERGTTDKSWMHSAKVGTSAAAARFIGVLVKAGSAVAVGLLLIVAAIL